MGIPTLWLAASWPAIAHADEHANAAATFTTPLPQVSYVRLEPSYTFLADGGTASALVARGVIVYRGWVVPGSGPANAVSGWRVDLSLQRMATPTLHATGLGKLGLTQLSGLICSWGSAGAGISMSLPTATSAAFGAADVQVGPAAFGYLSAIPGVPASLVITSLFATGSSPAIVTTLEPTISFELGHTFALLSDAEIEIDWFAHDARVPLNLRVGITLGTEAYLELGPALVIAGSTRGEATLDAQLDFLL